MTHIHINQIKIEKKLKF